MLTLLHQQPVFPLGNIMRTLNWLRLRLLDLISYDGIDAGDIRVTAKLIGSVFDIPSRDASLPYKPIDYFPMAPPSDFGCLEPKKISLAISDIKVVARCNKKIPKREPENMRLVHVHVAVLYFQCLNHGPLHACQAPEPWIDEWTANELDKKADHVISQGCIVDKAKKGKKKKKAASSKVENKKARCKRHSKDSDQALSTRCRTTLQQRYMDAHEVICFH
ncbi:uncharacterized protein DS421_8g234730 [Arachis hypogaea]|nr:uncharacterized protein DS421_8g234730 [Arachis hypogaea]